MTDSAAPTDDDRRVVMGVRRRGGPRVGVQFHPESVLTENCERLVTNFVAVRGGDDE